MNSRRIMKKNFFENFLMMEDISILEINFLEWNIDILNFIVNIKYYIY
jgi:hypothetical protein